MPPSQGCVLFVLKVEMASSDWQLSLKMVDQPKSTFHFPEMMPGDVPPGGYRVATLKQLVAAQLSDSIPDPELIGLYQRWRLNEINELRMKCLCGPTGKKIALLCYITCRCAIYVYHLYLYFKCSVPVHVSYQS